MRLRDRVSKSDVLLVLLGCIVLTLYRVGVAANSPGDIRWLIKLVLVQSVIYLPAVWIVLRNRPSRVTLFIVIAFALLFRLSILFSPPYLSDDIYRYIWDGRVQAAGINPYRYVPAAPQLAHLRDDNIYPKINRRDHAHTIYPPLAEGLFLVTTRISESVVWMKITMLVFEVVAVWAMFQLLISLGLARERLLIYAWHPLVVWEFAGSGHVDAIAIAFIALALLAFHRKAGIAAGFALACATLIKLFPIVLLPALYKPRRWIIPAVFSATVVLAYLPYLSIGPKALLGYLPGYAQEQGLVSGQQFYVLNLARKLFGTDLPAVVFVAFAAIVLSGILGWTILRKTHSPDPLRLAMVLATATTVLFAPHYSWYFAWLIPFLCFTPSVAVFYLTIAGFILYFTWLGDSPNEMFVINSIIYLPFFLIGAIEFFRREERATKEHEIAFS
jgi:alpha-1,6-mannosyltransferase